MAPAELATLAVAHFRGRGGGILIHLSSRAAHRGEKPLLGAYAASKAGLNALSHTVARNDGAAGVLSYAIAPGWVGTDMSWDYIEETGDRGPLAENALGTLIPPEEVANIVTFLASGAARHAHRHGDRHQWGVVSAVGGGGRMVHCCAHLTESHFCYIGTVDGMDRRVPE